MKSRVLIVWTCLALLFNGTLSVAHAEVIGTAAALAAESQGAAPIDRVRSALDRDAVRVQMAQLGVDREALDQRILALTDAELSQLANRLDQQPAGGVLEVIGIVFVVLIILEFAGVIDIFKRAP